MQPLANPVDDCNHPLHPKIEFDWSSVDPNLREEASAMAMQMAQKFILDIFDFMHQGGNSRPQGVMIRAYVIPWMVLPYFQHLSQTELADLMGLKKKQSVGREVARFRQRFHMFNAHMQTETARETCRRRESRKRAERYQAEGFLDFQI